MIDQRYANYYIQNGDSSDNEHISFLAGVRIIRKDRHPDKYSGYQVMRLVREKIKWYLKKKNREIENLTKKNFKGQSKLNENNVLLLSSFK